MFALQTAHGTVMAYDRRSGLVVSCTQAQLGELYGPVLGYVSEALPHACFLFAGDRPDRAIFMQGGPAAAPIIAMRIASVAENPRFVALIAPHAGLFACAAAPEGETPRVVAPTAAERRAYECFAPVQLPAGNAARLPTGLEEQAAQKLTGPSMLKRLQAGVRRDHLPAFLAVASLLQEDDTHWLAGIILTSPPALAALKAVAPEDPWAQIALPRLQESLQGTPPPAATKIGPELDGLADAGRHDHPASFAHRCNALARSHVAPRRTLAVLASARNEGLYLLEWVAHHKLVGAERLFLYSNDNEDGSDDMLRILARNGEITWIESELAPGSAAQTKAYGHALGFAPEILDYRWSLLIDLDEFFGFDTSRFSSALDYIGWQETQPVHMISLDWLMYGSDGLDRWTDAPMTMRFTRRLPWIDMHVKTMVRTGLCMHSHPHYPVLARAAGAIRRDEAGRVFEQGASPSFNAKPSADLAWIAHYWLRSAQEFAWKNARNRGDHALVKGTSVDLIAPDVTAMFLEHHAGANHVNDPRMTRGAPELQREMLRLRALPGMERALAAAVADFRARVEEITAGLAAVAGSRPADSPISGLLELLRR